MAHTAAVRGTAMVVSGRVKVDMKDRILKLQPSQTPFRVFTTKVGGKRKAVSAKFEWIEDSFDPRWVTLAGAISGGAASEDSVATTAGQTEYMKVGDVLWVAATNEKVWVDDISVSGDTIDITRVGSGDITTAALGTKLLIIGSAFEEGSGKGTEYTAQLTLPWNYTQIFKTDYGITGTAAATAMYGCAELKRLRAKKGIEHNLDIEYGLMFGERDLQSAGTHPRRFTRGAIHWVEDGGLNIDTSSYAAYTVDDFEAYLAGIFANGAYSSDQKLAFCGQDIITLVNSWALPSYRLKTGETKFGVPIMRYQSAHGEVVLIKQPLFDSGLVKYALIVDPANLAYVYLQGRDTHLWANVEDNDVDGSEEEYLTECGLEMSKMATHGLMKLAA